MTKISFVLALSLAGFGCKKGGPDCGKAIAHSMELSKADMQKMGVDDKMMAKMADLGVKHCKDDKWADEAVTCMTNAKAETDAQGCYDKLTADQRDKMNKAAMELQPSAPPAAPPPAAGSGSDAAMSGSGGATAGSGSAGSATP